MFWDNFCEICKLSGDTPSGVIKKMGIAAGSVTKWKNGVMPSKTSLEKISNYFGIPVENFFAKEKPTDAGELPEGERMWLEVYRKLSPQTRDTIARVLGAYDTLPPDLQGPVMELIISSLHKQ